MEKVRRRGKLVYFIEIKNPRQFWGRIYEKTVCFRKINMPFEKSLLKRRIRRFTSFMPHPAAILSAPHMATQTI